MRDSKQGVVLSMMSKRGRYVRGSKEDAVLSNFLLRFIPPWLGLLGLSLLMSEDAEIESELTSSGMSPAHLT